jgi:uncharacterized protein YjbI with pentapeptide repeats
MKRAINIFFIFLLIIVLALFLSHELRCLTISWFNKIATWLYPKNDDRNAELLKIFLSVFAGMGVFVGIYVSLWRAKTTEESVKLQGEAITKQGQQIQLSVKSQIDERFSNAIEHLGSAKEPVLLGGIAELHQIAKENRKDYAEVVFNILCSYIRSNTNFHNKKVNDFSGTAIQTIIDYLFKPQIEDENPYKDFKADLGHSNLFGVNLNNCDFTGADFSFCLMPSLENVILNNANIGKAKFSVATLRNVSAKNARVFNTKFNLSHLENVSFENCSDASISFVDTDLRNVNFQNAKLYKCNFISSLLSEVKFDNAEIITCCFACSLLINIKFLTIPVMYENDFRGVGFNDVMFNSYMSRSKFNGCNSSKADFKFFFEERLKAREGLSADVSLIGYSDILFSHCDMGVLSIRDIEEIKEKYKKEKEEIEKY